MAAGLAWALANASVELLVPAGSRNRTEAPFCLVSGG